MFHKVRAIFRAHGLSGLARRSVAYAYRPVSKLRRTGNPREHFHSFERKPTAAQSYEGDIERAFYQHEGRGISKWGHYLEIYEKFLSPLKKRETLRLLEIGVAQG